jgi:SAM-dependent methyltransferase
LAAPTQNVRLGEDRIGEFDSSSTAEHTAGPVEQFIRRSVERDDLLFVDVGGGNGTFLDSLLRDFPRARGINVDSSPSMCEKNRTDERKAVHCGDFTSWAERREKASSRVDVVFFNFVLHHFVSSTYSGSVANQKAALQAASRITSPDGLVVVYEINYNGAIADDLPGRLIYRATSSRLLLHFARRMGANTAGYGVCFHSELFWKRLFSEAGLSVRYQHQIASGEFNGLKPAIHKLALNIRSMDYKLYCLGKST